MPRWRFSNSLHEKTAQHRSHRQRPDRLVQQLAPGLARGVTQLGGVVGADQQGRGIDACRAQSAQQVQPGCTAVEVVVENQQVEPAFAAVPPGPGGMMLH